MLVLYWHYDSTQAWRTRLSTNMRVSRLRLALEMVGMLEPAVPVLLLAVGPLPDSSEYVVLLCV